MVLTESNRFWTGRRVLITGHTGFKGSWLAIWLQRLGAEVIGVALPPDSSPNLFECAQVESGIQSYYCDIRDYTSLARLVKQSSPDIVFHLAAQALVRASYRDPITTYATNVMGTANLLEAMRGTGTIRVAVMVTTDKVYKNNEWIYPYRETDTLGGHDPYSASKAASEIIIESYRDAFLNDSGVALASARAGNVIGGGDWSADRLIPDAVRAWTSGTPLEIRRPAARRPWQHVLEPLSGYIKLAEMLWHQKHLSGAYNFGPAPSDAASVRDVIELARDFFGQGNVVYGDGMEGPHEAGMLALDNAKARELLTVIPEWNLHESVRRTMKWYLAHVSGADARELCLADITDYES